MKKCMPVLFIGHGSPMNMIEDNSWTRAVRLLKDKIPKPGAILVISAHWLTRGTVISDAVEPEMIYDYYGFPEKLYQISYPAKGSPEVAKRVCSLLSAYQPRTEQRGMDHAAYAILTHLYPDADIPVVEMSLDMSKPASWHYMVGSRLMALREEGVLIIGSGDIVHNLQEIDPRTDAPPALWASRFDRTVALRMEARQDHTLTDLNQFGSDAQRSVPTMDHYLPLMWILGLRKPEDRLHWIHTGIQNASVSMRSFIFES